MDQSKIVDVIEQCRKWFESEQGKAELNERMRRVDKIIAELNEARQVDEVSLWKRVTI